MSRLDYIESTDNDEGIQKPFAKLYNQNHCNYCFDAHTENMIGSVSLKLDMWFCGPTCQHMYLYDNKLANFTPELKAELEKIRKKFYSSDKFLKRQKKS